MQRSSNILNPLQQELIRNKVKTEFYPFLNPQLKELVIQMDMYVQLLFQVLLHDSSIYQTKESNPLQQRKKPDIFGKEHKGKDSVSKQLKSMHGKGKELKSSLKKEGKGKAYA